jgi:hypothetical protein
MRMCAYVHQATLLPGARTALRVTLSAPAQVATAMLILMNVAAARVRTVPRASTHLQTPLFLLTHTSVPA